MFNFFSPSGEDPLKLLGLGYESDGTLDNSNFLSLCDDVVGIIYSFLDLSSCSSLSRISKQWRRVYLTPEVWKEKLLLVLPETKRIPSKLKFLNSDFYRVSYLYVMNSSWKWDGEDISTEYFTVDDDLRTVKTKKECVEGKNLSVFYKFKYYPNSSRKVNTSVIEIEVVESNNANCSFGVSNELFERDRFCGFGVPIKDYKKDVNVQISYGYSSNGMIRKNGKETRSERFGKNDRIGLVWIRNLPGHEFRFYKNGVFVGSVGEPFEIRTRFLRPMATLYKALKSDSNEFEIKTQGIKIPFWGVIYPSILRDFGKKFLSRKKIM